MSAALAWHGTSPAAEPACAPARPQLRLVPTGADVAATPRRVARRVRVALTLTVAAALAITALILTQALSAPAAGPTEVLTVESGQTLSEIAAVKLPELPVREGVVAIQRANHLGTDAITAGQTLVIPAR